jgi:hypothetical protein
VHVLKFTLKQTAVGKGYKFYFAKTLFAKFPPFSLSALLSKSYLIISSSIMFSNIYFYIFNFTMLIVKLNRRTI